MLLSLNNPLKLSENIQEKLCCPVCQSNLQLNNEQLDCTDFQCSASFPIVSGVPILIHEENSIFSIQDFIQQESTTFDLKPKPKLIDLATTLLPAIDMNIKSESNFQKFVDLVSQQNPHPKVLVIGGSILGKGMADIMSNSCLELINSDVSFGPYTDLVCDAHDIPFADNSFDGVIVQAVLEHVVDPNRCVAEIYRVLKDDGVVYAETPFMQQVHMGRYDFTRFTHLGHRRLFRQFEEVESGPVCGPGMALAWSYQYFLLSFVKSKAAKSLVKGFTRLTSFWLKYFDYFLIDRPGTFDAAAGYYFIGKKSQQILSDRELLKLYKGIQ